jgi:cytidine deaminase
MLTSPSKFRAGAAVQTASGNIVPGVIVENASLGLAVCAERVALFSTVAPGTRPLALALVAPRTGDDLTWPCGAASRSHSSSVALRCRST